MTHVPHVLAAVTGALVALGLTSGGVHPDAFADQRAAVPPVLDGMRVSLDELEEHADRYMGLTVTVSGAVDEVLGPRIFTIAEADAGDDDVLVALPDPMVAAVRGGEPVTITGTMKPFAHDEFQRSWNWLGLDPDAALDMALNPVLVASRIAAAGGQELVVHPTAAGRPVGTTGSLTPAAAEIRDLAAVVSGTEGLVGRRVALPAMQVSAVAAAGFFVNSAGRLLFVLPGERSAIPREGDRVAVDGLILRLPERIEDRLSPPAAMNDSIYVYAGSISLVSQ